MFTSLKVRKVNYYCIPTFIQTGRWFRNSTTLSSRNGNL